MRPAGERFSTGTEHAGNAMRTAHAASDAFALWKSGGQQDAAAMHGCVPDGPVAPVRAPHYPIGCWGLGSAGCSFAGCGSWPGWSGTSLGVMLGVPGVGPGDGFGPGAGSGVAGEGGSGMVGPGVMGGTSGGSIATWALLAYFGSMIMVQGVSLFPCDRDAANFSAHVLLLRTLSHVNTSPIRGDPHTREDQRVFVPRHVWEQRRPHPGGLRYQ